MAWELNSDRPIYIQLMDNIKFNIISGRYRSGDRLPSVRDLAKEAAVNPNTMQKALSELEMTGLILSNRTSGRFVTEDNNLIRSIKKDLAKEYCNEFLDRLHNIGLNDEEIRELVKELI
jgi:DNA-binding transcriptional regulator YhcF (GntR family)